MLTVGRGLRTTAIAQWRAFPASGLAAVIYVSDNCLGTQHSALWPRRKVVLQQQSQIVCRYSTPPVQHKERHVVTLRYEARAEREARDTRTGLAAEPLVLRNSRKVAKQRDAVCCTWPCPTAVSVGEDSVPIQLAQCWFPGLAVPDAKI